MPTAVEIFLAGWNEYHKRSELLRLVEPFANPARMSAPTADEIMKILRDQEPPPKGPPYDVADMRETPIG